MKIESCKFCNQYQARADSNSVFDCNFHLMTLDDTTPCGGETNGWDVEWRESGLKWKPTLGGEHWHLKLGAKYVGVVFRNGTHCMALQVKISNWAIESNTLHDCARALVAAVKAGQ